MMQLTNIFYKKRDDIMKFELVSNYQPTGDQPVAIEQLVNGINAGKKNKFF